MPKYTERLLETYRRHTLDGLYFQYIALFCRIIIAILILISFVFPSVWSAANSDESAGFGVGQLQSKGSVISNTLTRGQVRRGNEGQEGRCASYGDSAGQWTGNIY